jgi:hypothetical protein
LIQDSGAEVIRLPPNSPNLNAYAERLRAFDQRRVSEQVTFIGQASLRRALCEYIEHYHEGRNHQGLGNRLIRLHKSAASDGCVHRRERLGGTLTFYCRQAA